MGCFSIHLLFCLISAAFSFSFESGVKLWKVRVSSSVFLVSSATILTEGGDDLRWEIQVGEPESPSCTSGGKFICSYLTCPIYLHSGWHKSGSPSFTLSESLKFAATVNISAAASNHSHNGPAFTPDICCMWVATWAIIRGSILQKKNQFFRPKGKNLIRLDMEVVWFWRLPAPDWQHMFFLFLFSTIRVLSEQLLQDVSFSCLTLISLYIVSLVFLPLSSPWQWNTVTPISGIPRHSNAAVWLSHFPAIEPPACQHFHLVLPTVTLSPFHLVASFQSSPLPPLFYSPSFRHSLYKRMAASKIRAKQSQHSHEHLFSPLALVLHFTFDFSVSVGGTPMRAASVWRATRLSKCPCWIKNTAYAPDVALCCDKEQYSTHPRKCNTRLREQKGAWGVQVLTEGQASLKNLLV